MKKIILFLAVIVATNVAIAQTINVKTHDKVLINTDPSQGVKSFVKWGVFPPESKEIRRIVMDP